MPIESRKFNLALRPGHGSYMPMFEWFSDIAKVIRLIKPKRALGVQVFILCSTFAETIIVAVIPLYLALLTDPSVAVGSFKEKALLGLGLSQNGQVNLQSAGLILFLAIVVSNVVIILSNRAVLRFGANLGADFSTSIFKYYLSRDYDFFLKNNSSEIVNDIMGESARLQCIGISNHLFPDPLGQRGPEKR